MNACHKSVASDDGSLTVCGHLVSCFICSIVNMLHLMLVVKVRGVNYNSDRYH